jgi:hypothetical protein
MLRKNGFNFFLIGILWQHFRQYLHFRTVVPRWAHMDHWTWHWHAKFTIIALGVLFFFTSELVRGDRLYILCEKEWRAFECQCSCIICLTDWFITMYKWTDIATNIQCTVFSSLTVTFRLIWLLTCMSMNKTGKLILTSFDLNYKNKIKLFKVFWIVLTLPFQKKYKICPG